MANKEFYRFAKAYDIAFSGKDYKAEVDFINWCFREHSKVISNNPSALELACGPARHAIELSRMNWKTYAIDLSPDMIEYAELLAREEKADICFLCGDMLNYKLNEPVAVTTIFTESITHILTNEDFIKHLKCVSANLLPGGLYIIETTHPIYFFPDGEDNIWKIKQNGMEVIVQFGAHNDEYDSFLQQWEITTKISIKEKDKLIQINESKSKHRWYLAQELRALIELSGEFEGVWFYGNMEVPPCKLADCKAPESMVIVLRKKIT